MKIVSQNLLIGLIFCLVSKTYAADLDTQELATQLKSLGAIMESLGQLQTGSQALARERDEYIRTNYQAFTTARTSTIMPQLHELIGKINNAMQQRTPISKQMATAWYREYRKIIEKYDKLLATYFGKKEKLKLKEFNEKELGVDTAINNLIDARGDTKSEIIELFRSAIEVEQKEAKQGAAQEEAEEEEVEEVPLAESLVK